MTRKRAPRGDLSSFQCEHFQHGQFEHDVYRKGQGPAVLVLTEVPGITPHVLGFADRLAARGLTAVLPDLFGEAGRDVDAENPVTRSLHMLTVITKLCVSREFTVLVEGKSSPVVDWLRALAHHEHERCKGPGVGVVGMCFTGGFALAMATDPVVIAPVLSQPSLPSGPFVSSRSIDASERELAMVRTRCERESLTVLGLRFKGDPLVPRARFPFLREKLGDAFVSVELPRSSGHPDSFMLRPHSVLTRDLIDEPGEATYEALQKVLRLFDEKLLGAPHTQA